MAKQTNPAQAQERASAFPIPFSKEEFRKDILMVFMHPLRTLGWMMNAETVAQMFNGKFVANNNGLLPLDCIPEDFGLAYEHIKETQFAYILERLYDYAFLGIIDGTAPMLVESSIYSWITAIVCDIAESNFATECEENGAKIYESAQRALLVAETANARFTLETGETFFEKFYNDTHEDELTIRQMALLSGMKEMSIRAATLETRASPLETFSSGDGVRIAPRVAEEWLKTKGRYLPIRVVWPSGDLDLANTRFKTRESLDDALHVRYKMIQERDGVEVTDARLAAAGVTVHKEFPGLCFDLAPNDYSSPSVMKIVAGILELPEELLILRSREMLILEQLAHIEIDLHQANAKCNDQSSA